METTLEVEGMHCRSCKLLLEDAVGEVEGVKSVKADFEQGRLQVEWEGEQAMAEIRKAIEKEGYRVKA